jgi:hypothetical protein
MICFYFAENQRQGAVELARLTDIINAGCFADDAEAVVNRIYDGLFKCIGDYGYREALYNQEKTLVDGNGALRLVEKIIKKEHIND